MTPEENDRSSADTSKIDSAVSPIDPISPNSPQSSNSTDSPDMSKTPETPKVADSPEAPQNAQNAPNSTNSFADRPNFNSTTNVSGQSRPNGSTNFSRPYFNGPYSPQPFRAPASPNFGQMLLKTVLSTVAGVCVLCLFGFFVFLFGLAALVGLLGKTDSTSELVAEEVVSGDDDAPGKIVILPIEGIIETDEWGFLREAIDIIRGDERVRGLVLRINSPGGTVSGSDYYYNLLKDLKEELEIPIVVSMGDVAASGGYYISTVADKIFAERSTETGSIGVIIPMYDASTLCEKFGVGSTPVVSGAMKGMGDFMKKPTPEERAIFQSCVDENFEQFLGVVREGRPWFRNVDENESGPRRANVGDVAIQTFVETKDVDASETTEIAESADVSETTENAQIADASETAETTESADVSETTENVQIADAPQTTTFDDREAQLRKVADGRIYTARQAKELHLIDEIGFLDDAVDEAVAMSGLDADSAQIVRFIETESFLDSLGLANVSAKSTDVRLEKAAKALASPKAYYLAPRAIPFGD